MTGESKNVMIKATKIWIQTLHGLKSSRTVEKRTKKHLFIKPSSSFQQPYDKKKFHAQAHQSVHQMRRLNIRDSTLTKSRALFPGTHDV